MWKMHLIFQNRINMQLCKVMDRGHIRVEIYERGAGYTLASGTGACAAAAASHKLDWWMTELKSRCRVGVT